MSGAIVERWTHATDPPRYVKSAPPTWDRGLDAEAARLRWLATTVLADHVPVVLDLAIDGDGRERLVTSARPGIDGATLAEELEDGDERGAHDLAWRFGATLRWVHDALDPAGCPFDGGLDQRLAAAARRIAEGGVDVAEFEVENAGRTPEDVLRELHATRPANEDLVVAHGDWCYPNVLFEVGGGWGIVDLGGLGVACRWNDLGIGARSTSHNLGDAAIPAFFEGYGVEPDEARVPYYMLLDELQ